MKRLVAVAAIAVVLIPFSDDADARRRLRRFQPTCGVAVTRSFRLAADLECLGGDAIVVGAPGITIDLDGHTVSGDFINGFGVNNLTGFHDDITVRNGTIKGFSYGYFGHSSADRTTLKKLNVSEHSVSGLAIRGGVGHKILRVTANLNIGHGIDVNPGTASKVIRCRATGNGSSGIALSVDGTRVKNNRASANSNDGLDVSGDGNRLINNRMTGNAISGFDVFGIANKITNNRAYSNGDDGFTVGGSGNRLVDNRADLNGFDVDDDFGEGIDASGDPAVSGRRNRAKGNDNPLQCVGIRCR